MNIKKTKILNTVLVLLMALTFQSCKEDPKPNTQPKNESELITTLILEAVDSSSGQKSVFKFKDTDGEGGNAPIQFDSILLNRNKTYFVNVVLLDESKASVDSISKEVLNEGEFHLFNYGVSNLDLEIKLNDQDKNGLPIGLKSIWRAHASGTGTIKVALKHQPGIKNGDPKLGETDIEIVFHSLIK